MRKKKAEYFLFLFLIFGLVILFYNMMTNGRYYTSVDVKVNPNLASTYFNVNVADVTNNYGISPGGNVTVHYNLINKENLNINTNKANFYLKLLNELGSEATDSEKITISSVEIGGTSYSYITGKGYGPINNLAYNGLEDTKTFDIVLHCANSYTPTGTLAYKVSVLAENPEDTTKYTTKTANLNIIVEQEYTVTFNSNEGSAVSNQTIMAGQKVTRPTDPTKAYNNFLGWYKESTFTNLWDFDADVVTDNITLYAKWEAITYTVSFNSNGGSAVSNQTINAGQKATRPTDPTKAYNNFLGWYKENTLTNLWDFDTDVVTGNTTLYAKWEAITYTVTFNSNGGTAVSNQTINAGQKATRPTDPTKAYNNFLGWYKESSLTNLWDFDTDVVTDNITLFAKWEVITYTVSFNSNGGTAVTAQTVNGGTLLTEPTEPTKTDGYIFDGWYKESTFDNLWNFSSDTVTENKTLYAKWAEAIYFQMPPDWYGTTVYAYIHRSTDSIKDEDLPKTDSVLMTLKDSTKNIYQFKLTDSNVNNISTYNKVIFYNDGDLTDDANLTRRRTVALNLTTSDFRKVYVPELYRSTTQMRYYGYASTLYEYLWKDVNGTQSGSSNAKWPGVAMTGDTVDGKRFHQRTIDLNTYNKLIINQGKGANQTENITIPITYGSNVIAQDLTWKISSTLIPDSVLGEQNNGRKFYSKSFRCIYNGSWHALDTWNSTDYSTWNSTGDGAKFRAAQTALGYK